MTDQDKSTSGDLFSKILELELCLRKIDGGNINVDEIRHIRGIAKDLIGIKSNGMIDSNKSFSKVLSRAACGNPSVKRFAALLVLRLLNVQGLLPNNQEDQGVEQNAVKLVESALPEFCKAFKFPGKKQTYEQISLLEQIHDSVMEHLLPLKHMPLVMQDIVSQKEVVYRAINNKLVKSYLSNYEYGKIQNIIRSLFERAEELFNIETELFGIKLDELKNLVADNIDYSKRFSSFLVQDYFLPLLESFEEATKKLDRDSTKNLDCSISPKKSSTYKAEKKYPLHEVGREVKIFHGSLSPLNVIASTLRDRLPHKKFVVVLDEFDEIPPEMYRHGPLAEAFFSNLRTLSSKKNMAFMLVGGEKMPFIMGAQGDQLNKFIGEQLDYFSKTDEHEDYVELVKKPVHQMLTWSEGTIEELFHLTNGHPFYTKLICSSIFHTAVSDRDADISVRDIQRTVENIVCELGVNQFAHHWKDGISKSEEEPISLDRCRVLVAVGRTMRRHKGLSFKNICINHHSTKLGDHQVKTILDDFCRRDILKEEEGQYEFVVPLFGMWLEQTGVDRLIADRFGDELAESLEEEEDRARISSSEIIKLVRGWSAYRGREITAENVRGWLDQRESFREQRLLFNILENLRFVTESDIREKLKLAHDKVRKVTPTLVTKNKRQKRNDIIVTYVDGEAKSGQYYASRYAEENKISASSVISPIESPNELLPMRTLMTLR